MNKTLITALLALSLVACAEVPTVTHDGLELVPDTKVDQVYRKPGADVSGYTQFAVSGCDVSFRKNWLRDQNSTMRVGTDRVTEKDMNAIRDGLSQLCVETFTEVLMQAPAYPIVAADSDAEGTLLLRPSIIELDVTAPDTNSPGRSRTYTTDAGQMTLLLEIEDNKTGEVLYRIVDRRRANQTMRINWSNSVTNTAEAKRILNSWGMKLRAGLDAVARAPGQ